MAGCTAAGHTSTGTEKGCECDCGGAGHGQGSHPVPAASTDGTVIAARPAAPRVSTFANRGALIPEIGVIVGHTDEHETTYTLDVDTGRWLKTDARLGEDSCWQDTPPVQVTLGKVLQAVRHDQQAVSHALAAHLEWHRANGDGRGRATAERALKPLGLRLA